MKYVIFDIDGTLTNTKKVEDKCFARAFEETFNINIDDQQWEAFKNVTDWGITEEIIMRETGREPSQFQYSSMIDNFIRHLQEERDKEQNQFSEVVGAREFFHELHELADFELGIATGSWERSARLKLESIGIDPGKTCFANSDYHKSRENITIDVIDQLKSKTKSTPERIIYFGDGEWDFMTCRNIGIDFIGIDVEEDGHLKSLGAQTVFKDYSNKKEILEKIYLKPIKQDATV